MKTIKRKFYYIAAVLSLIFTLSSCEYVGLGIEIGNGTNSYHESTDYLCSRIWTDEWTDEYGVYYYQEICFYPNNTGVDYLYSQDATGTGKNQALISDGTGGTATTQASVSITATDIRTWKILQWEETS